MSENFKKAYDIEGISEEAKKLVEEESRASVAKSTGVAGEHVFEPLPEFLSTPSEHVITNKNNAWVVLGRDRPSSRLSGYGGKGHTQAASIDVVVGRMAHQPKGVNEEGEKLWTDPDFKTDAARIYISQKTDVDQNFNVDVSRFGEIRTRSAIAMKADQVRVVAREKIRLVTGTDQKNSQGAEIREVGGIELMADNDESELQPIPKGENLQAALERLTEHVDSLAGILDSFLMSQFEYNERLATHWHNSPFFAAPTTPSSVLIPAGQKNAIELLQKVKKSIVNLKTNLASYKVNYLSPVGEKYICSRKNKTN